MAENGRRGFDRRGQKRFQPRECQLALSREATGLMRLFGGGKKTNLAHAVVDLSEGGARFVTRQKVDLGTRVIIAITVKFARDVINATGTVCWCGPRGDKPGHYFVAVRFDKLEAPQARKISAVRQYLDSPEYRQKVTTRRRFNPYESGMIEYDID